MKFFGIEFVPLNVPLKNRLEALAALGMLVLLIVLAPIGIFTTIYLLLFTKLWPIVCVYLFWIWVIDKNVPETGGRRNEWVCSWTLFRYVKNYFPIIMKSVPGFQVDPKRNYLICPVPHGYMPLGAMTALQSNASEEKNTIFPQHTAHGLTLNINFKIPILREFVLAFGMCNITPKSIRWLLNYSGGGKLVGIVIGGAAEAAYCHEKKYYLKLKDRKGFAKLALQNGSHIIPSFSFGQNKLYRQIVFAEGSVLRRAQDLFKRLTGASLLAIYGRGLFQYTFGFIPLQHPIYVIVGAPIEVNKIEEPTQNDIDSLHTKFMQKLIELFEQYKYEYEDDPEESGIVFF